MSELNIFDILQGLVPELEAEGYEVFPRPGKLLLPAFLRDFRPHLVAFRKDKNLVVEIIGKSPGPVDRVKQLTELLKGQAGWDFRTVFISSARDQEPLPVQSAKSMKSRIDEVRRLTEAGHSEPAILLAFATFEALGRVALSKQFERPQTPGRLIEGLGHEGYLMPKEADHLRLLAAKRNRVAHGDFDVRVSKAELKQLLAILDEMLKLTAEEPVH